MDRRIVLAGLGAGVLAVGGFALTRPTTEAASSLLPVGAANAQAVATDGTLPQVVEMVLGADDAPVTVIEYASFTCPHCRTFHDNVMPQIKANYIDTGQVRFIYREVYFDRPSLWAAMVARCAGPLRYFGIVDLIYDGQAEWTQGSPTEIAANLRRIGRTAGLDDATLDQCLTDAEMAQALVAQYEANREEHEISGTPSFVIDGEMHSNMSYAEFAALIDARLAAQ